MTGLLAIVAPHWADYVNERTLIQYAFMYSSDLEFVTWWRLSAMKVLNIRLE